MNILRRALFHQNLFTGPEDVYPGAPLSAPVQTQTSHHMSGALEVEHYLAYTASFNLTGAAPTWGVGSPVYAANNYLDSEGMPTVAPFTSINKAQIATGTGSTDPIHARVDINSTILPSVWLTSFPKSWAILMHLKSGNKVPMTTLTHQTNSILRVYGSARFDVNSVAAGDAMILKLYMRGNPK